MSERSDSVRRLQAASRPGSTPALLLKRLIDLGVALPLCLVLSPLYLLVALAIKIESRGPILFRQQRRGLRFRPFTMLKFRSLRHGAGDPHERYEMSESDPRITRVGAWIRRTSLDELPQLFNVIGGSMSLVGPRPLVEWESRECLVRHERRFLVKPGITGLSQVMVRNAVDLDARSDWDVEYVRRWSVPLDLGILLKTPFSIFRTRAVYPAPARGGSDEE